MDIIVHEDGPVTFGELYYGVAAPGTGGPDVGSGHWLEAGLSLTGFDSIEQPTVTSAYPHPDQLGTEKMDQKCTHLELVDACMAELLAAAYDGEPRVVMAGDPNVVRSECDIKNRKPNHNKIAGVMNEEITHLEGWFASGWMDAPRHLMGGRGAGALHAVVPARQDLRQQR